VILLLGIYPKEHKTGFSRDTCTMMFITALFTISQLWEQPRCPTTDEWNMKMWHIYTMEYYLATRNNDMGFEGKWMQLEEIMLSKIARIRNTKSTCFLSWVEDRSKDKQYIQKQA
jgi:hypothetical protein